MENFSINTPKDQSEAIKFQANELGPIKLDGTLSAIEINHLNDTFREGCNAIHNETDGELSDFLHSEVVPNLDSPDLDPQVRECLNNLVIAHPETNSTVSLSPEISEYFQIESGEDSELSKNLEQLSKLGLDLNKFLVGLQAHIDGELSFLSPEAKEKICKSIGLKTLALGGVLENMNLHDFSGQELLNQRWIVNGKIQEAYSFYTQSLFPSLGLHNAIRSGKAVSTDFTDEKEIRTLENGTTYEANNQKYVDINMHMEEIDELLAASVDDEGNFDEGFFSTQEILSITNEKHEALLTDMGITSGESISLLNEEDQQAESIASLGEMCLVGISCLPYIGAVPSIIMDVNDLLGNQSVATNALKGGDLIPAGYQVETSWINSLVAGASLALTPSGMQGFAKAGKLAKAASKIDNLNPRIINQTIDTILQHLGIGDWVKDKLKGVLGFGGDTNPRGINSNFGENRTDTTFMHRAENNGLLSDTPGTHDFNVQGQIIKVSEREQAFLIRLQDAYINGESSLDINGLEEKNITILLDIVNRMHLEHGDVAIGEHTREQIADKLRIARSSGMDRDIYRIAIREGFAGVNENSIGSIIENLNKNMSPEELFGLVVSKLPEGSEFNFWEINDALALSSPEPFIDLVQAKIGNNVDLEKISVEQLKSTLNTVEEIPSFNPFTADDNALMRFLQSKGVEIDLPQQQSVIEMRSFFESYEGGVDVTGFIIAKKIGAKGGLEGQTLLQVLSEGFGGDISKLRRIPGEVRKYNSEASEKFVSHFHTGGNINLDMNSIHGFFAANRDIKVLDVHAINFDEIDSTGGRLYQNLLQLAEKEGTEYFVSPYAVQDNIRSAA